MRGVQRQFHILRRGAGDLAKRQARDRSDVGKIFTFDWRNKFSAYVIVIALLEGIGHTHFADVCEIHVVLYLIVGGDAQCDSLVLPDWREYSISTANAMP